MKYFEFTTEAPTIEIEQGTNIVYPFSPPIFQTHISDEFKSLLLTEGEKLTKRNNDFRSYLAGNFINGISLNYPREDIATKYQPYIFSLLMPFLEKLKQIGGGGQIRNLFEVQKAKGSYGGQMAINSLWINYQKKHDYNPSHVHSGSLSFVTYLKCPSTIFEYQAVTNTENAGHLVFEYGEKMSELSSQTFKVKPYENLMFIFPNNLRHTVPPFYTDDERISVSGNIIVE
jgi:hypothetical protein